MEQTSEHLQNTLTDLKPRGTAMTVVIPKDVHGSLRALAAANERSLSGEVRWVLRRYSEDPELLHG